MSLAENYESFHSWEHLLGHLSAGYEVFYHAPLDYRPSRVSVAVRKDGKLRVTPIYADADPFTADAGHLDRFKRIDRRF